jgi:hypothetical protein
MSLFGGSGNISADPNLSLYIAADDAGGSVPGSEVISLEAYPPANPPSGDVQWTRYGNLLYAAIDPTAALLLTENTTYWLAVKPEAETNDYYYSWYLNNQGVTDSYAAYSALEQSDVTDPQNPTTTFSEKWEDYSGDGNGNTPTFPAFAINGPVPTPEPSGGMLLGLLTAAAGLLRRRRSS